MKLLVTGGAGFMGSNFIRFILTKYPSYRVVNLDSLTYAGNLTNLADVENNPRYQFIQGDIADLNKVQEALNAVDAVINYAADTHVDRSIMDPFAFARTNVMGTLTLLQASKDASIAKLVHISTDEVFGSIETGSFTESSPFEPNSPYAASKAGGDLLCRSFFVTYQFPVIVSHSVNFVGPFQFPEKLIPLTITNILEGKKIPVYGDGLQSREYIFTTDHCNAVDILIHKGKAGEIYNIGCGYESTTLNTVHTILTIMGKDESSIEFVKDRPGHDRRYSINSSKIQTELGWKPEYSFAQALQETVDWYTKNEAWWKPLKEKNIDYFAKQYNKLPRSKLTRYS